MAEMECQNVQKTQHESPLPRAPLRFTPLVPQVNPFPLAVPV